MITFELLAERTSEQSISHKTMPTRQEHEQFMLYHPYRQWWIILNEQNAAVGAILATRNNEIGIAILARYQRQGYARQAIQMLIDTIQPFPPVAGLRGAGWLANCNPANEVSIKLFAEFGFTLKQHTYGRD